MNLLNRFLTWLLGEKCPVCGSRDTKRSRDWVRGADDLYKQAIGDSGFYCCKCMCITWDRSFEDYKKSLPAWCRAYDE